MFQSSPGTSALLSIFEEGLASGKKRRMMAAAKPVPVSMLSGFLGSGASPAPSSASTVAFCSSLVVL